MSSLQKQFEKIYDQYINKIYRFIFLKVGSKEISEDLTTQVFIKGWKKFKEYSKEIKNPGAYLYQIAKTEIVDYYRKESKFKNISFEINQEIFNQIIDFNSSKIEEDLTLKREIELLKTALDQLRDDYQNLIIWRYLDELSPKEIAEIIEKPEGTTRVMLFRALGELREKMEFLLEEGKL